jgi:hypothetical protein
VDHGSGLELGFRWVLVFVAILGALTIRSSLGETAEARFAAGLDVERVVNRGMAGT